MVRKAIWPPHLRWDVALRLGYVGEIRSRKYLDWIKSNPCHTCGAPPPSDPSHGNFLKGAGTKAPDLIVIPQCRRCHEEYERRALPELLEEDAFMAAALIYLIKAYCEGVVRI